MTHRQAKAVGMPSKVRSCPAGCQMRHYTDAVITHLNDDHHWDDDAIVAWLEGLGL